MTRAYRVSKKAEDILIGDKVYGWSFRRDEVRETAARVLDWKEKQGKVMITTEDWTILVHPEMLMVVEEVA